MLGAGADSASQLSVMSRWDLGRGWVSLEMSSQLSTAYFWHFQASTLYWETMKSKIFRTRGGLSSHPLQTLVSVFSRCITKLPTMYWLNNHHHFFAHDSSMLSWHGSWQRHLFLVLLHEALLSLRSCCSPFSCQIVHLLLEAGFHGEKGDAAWLPRAWPRTAFHRILWV